MTFLLENSLARIAAPPGKTAEPSQNHRSAASQAAPRHPSPPAERPQRPQRSYSSDSSLVATSVRSSPTTSGGSNGAPNPPDLRLTHPVISPARLAPWQSQSCAATSASHCGGTSSTSAAYK